MEDVPENVHKKFHGIISILSIVSNDLKLGKIV